MNKKELILAVSQSQNLSKKEVECILNAVTDTIIERLRNGEKVQLSGFGTFEMKKRAAKIARNPRTGEVIPLSETLRPAFTPGVKWKEDNK